MILISFLLSLILVQEKDRCSNSNRLILYRKNIGHGELWKAHDYSFYINFTQLLVLEKTRSQSLKWKCIQKGIYQIH